MDAIATYEALWFEGRYRFNLLPDAIHVIGGTFLQTDQEVTVPLAGLQARVDRLRVRSAYFWAGGWMMIAGYVGFAVLVAGFKLDPLGFAPALIGVIGLAGLCVALATFRKIEFAQFVTDAGVPALAIARSRRRIADFEGFVEKVLGQIRACKGLA
jgi:hypothetical protein